MRHRDPNLFYLTMEVTVRKAGLKTVLALDEEARPAALQSCHPKGDSKFSLQMRRGGLVKIYDSVLMPNVSFICLLLLFLSFVFVYFLSFLVFFFVTVSLQESFNCRTHDRGWINSHFIKMLQFSGESRTIFTLRSLRRSRISKEITSGWLSPTSSTHVVKRSQFSFSGQKKCRLQAFKGKKPNKLISDTSNNR